MVTMKERWRKLIARVVDPALVEKVELIKGGGSDRAFYRIFSGEKSYVLFEPKTVEELREYTTISSFLFSRGLMVPEMLATYESSMAALFFDAGSNSLQSIVKELLEYEDERGVISLYKKVIRNLIKLQKLRPDDAPEIIQNRFFDFGHYSWETLYFREKLAHGYLGFESKTDSELTLELRQLAESLVDEPKCIVHRDLQSQNIYGVDNRFYFLDFQSARLGSQFYDLASLLRDPYVELPDSIHEPLFEYYLKEQKKTIVGRDFEYDEARDIYNRISLQRLMQALGAYGNLGHFQGKDEFLWYIEPALNLLARTLEEMEGFDTLKNFTFTLSVKNRDMEEDRIRRKQEREELEAYRKSVEEAKALEEETEIIEEETFEEGDVEKADENDEDTLVEV